MCREVLHSLTQNAPLLPINHRQGPYSIASFAIVYWPQFIDLRLPQQVASNLKREEKKVFCCIDFPKKMKSFAIILSFLVTLALSKPVEIEDIGIETEDFNVDEITTSEQISEENFRSFRKPTKIRQAEIDNDAARNARFNFGYSIQVKKGMILI